MTGQRTRKNSSLNKGQRRALLLLLIGCPGPRGQAGEPIFGITRLQKLLFLLEKEYNIAEILDSTYDFEAWRFGPYTPELYDDLEFLENLGLIEAREFGPQTLHEQWEEDYLDKQVYLSQREEDETDKYQGKAFKLSDPDGHEKYQQLQNMLQSEGVELQKLMSAIREVKSAYGEMPLRSLISHVYNLYPDYASKSELKHLF